MLIQYNRIISIAAIIVCVAAVSCKREENPRTVTDPAQTEKEKETYTQPLEEKILLGAATAKVEINGFEETSNGATVVFATAYTYFGKKYTSVTVASKYIKAASKTSSGVVLTFGDSKQAKFEYQKEVSLDIDSELSFKDYMSEKKEIPFKVTKAGRGDLSVTAKGEGDFAPEIVFDRAQKQGTIRFELNSEPGKTDRATVTLTDGKAVATYAITASTYHFGITVDDVLEVEPRSGSVTKVEYTVDTDIPDYEVVITQSGDFFKVEDGVVAALSTNESGTTREGSLSFTEKSGKFVVVTVKVLQKSLRTDRVMFKDSRFKAVMLELCESDGDGEVSFDEALTVQELVAVGKGITDITGIEYFKNAWKVDLQNNDIVDGTLLKELPLLYWMDLKGNMHLKTFDVTGCTQYFEHSEFQVNDDLVYYSYRYQYGVSRVSDPYSQHVPDVPDTKVTTDWSAHKRMTKVRTHTKEITKEAFPWINAWSDRDYQSQEHMVPSIVFTGLGYIDVDIQNGTWKRIFDQAREAFFSKTSIGEYLDYFDVYYLEYLVDKREKYYFNPEALRDSEECETALNLLAEDSKELHLFAYENLYGDTKDQISIFAGDYPSRKYPAQLYVEITPFPYKGPFVVNNRCSFTNTYFGPIAQYTGDGREFIYSFDYSTNSRYWTEYKEPTIQELIEKTDEGQGQYFLKFCGLKEGASWNRK